MKTEQQADNKKLKEIKIKKNEKNLNQGCRNQDRNEFFMIFREINQLVETI